MRRQALVSAFPDFTNAAATARCGYRGATQGALDVRSLQEYHAATPRRPTVRPPGAS